MSFTVFNTSNNPQRLSDKKLLAPGESRVLEVVSDRDRDLADRKFLSIVEETKAGGTKTAAQGAGKSEEGEKQQ